MSVKSSAIFASGHTWMPRVLIYREERRAVQNNVVVAVMSPSVAIECDSFRRTPGVFVRPPMRLPTHKRPHTTDRTRPIGSNCCMLGVRFPENPSTCYCTYRMAYADNFLT